MPAGMAGTEARKDASGDIHVNLDSSTPCWNDAIERVLLELTAASEFDRMVALVAKNFATSILGSTTAPLQEELQGGAEQAGRHRQESTRVDPVKEDRPFSKRDRYESRRPTRILFPSRRRNS
jgi:hypothetical protein